MREIFKQDVIEGLSKKHKAIPSRYFYDAIGDQLFQQIMNLDEYYLPDCEQEIIKNESTTLANLLLTEQASWNIMELGAGDGTKTVQLLRSLHESKLQFSYTAFDISENILQENRRNITDQLPNLCIKGIHGDYFSTFHPEVATCENNLILFMGSNIGNYTYEEAEKFCHWLCEGIHPTDRVLIAFDLKKNPKKVLDAYNDHSGITRNFNLNLLSRINRELEADFKVNQYDHYATYDPVSGLARSYIISLKEQVVTINGQSFRFQKDEPLHTEISKKYDLEEIEKLGQLCNLQVVEHLMDIGENYSLSLFSPISPV